MKKWTKEGAYEPMTPLEEAVVLVAIAITSALYGVALYKLWQLIF